MEIVKFEDGTYGIRRTKRFLWMRYYEFLAKNCNVHAGFTYNSWEKINTRIKIKFDSYDDALDNIENYNVKPEKRKYDFGKPVGVD